MEEVLGGWVFVLVYRYHTWADGMSCLKLVLLCRTNSTTRVLCCMNANLAELVYPGGWLGCCSEGLFVGPELRGRNGNGQCGFFCDTGRVCLQGMIGEREVDIPFISSSHVLGGAVGIVRVYLLISYKAL